MCQISPEEEEEEQREKSLGEERIGELGRGLGVIFQCFLSHSGTVGRSNTGSKANPPPSATIRCVTGHSPVCVCVFVCLREEENT